MPPKSALIERYDQLKPDGHYFDQDTMSFFKSDIHEIERTRSLNWVFITSERGPHMKTWRYSVRLMCNESGKIETLGPFCEMTHKKAREIMRKAIARDIDAENYAKAKLCDEYIQEAKGAYEAAGGAIDDETIIKRKAAESWAEACGYKIHWTSIHPDVVSAKDPGNSRRWAAWRRLYGLDLFDSQDNAL